MATAGIEDDMASVASISFSEQHTTQREEEKGRNHNFDEKTLSSGSSDNIVEATLTRSQIAEARRERLQLVQDEMDAKKLRAQAAGKVERARDEVAQRQFLVERARVAAVNMQNQKHQYAMSQTM